MNLHLKAKRQRARLFSLGLCTLTGSGHKRESTQERLSVPKQSRSHAAGSSLPRASLWGRRIVWCTLTSWYLVSLLPVSIVHVSVILLVGFWSWEISFIMWGCRGWGWQAAGTWVSVSREMVGSPPSSGDLEPANQYAPSKKPAGELKSQRAPKFEQKSAPFVPTGLLCKHVTNHFVTRM